MSTTAAGIGYRKYQVKLTRTSDGASKVVDLEWGYPEWDGSDSDDAIRFMWEEGNYSCDCNRCEYFDEDCECSEGKYEAEVLL